MIMDRQDAVGWYGECDPVDGTESIFAKRGFYEVDVVQIDSFRWASLTWQVNVTGWRTITAYIWSMNDVYPSDNKYSDYIWVVPSQGSPTGDCWLNITEEGLPHEGYDNYLYFGVENWGN